MVIVTLSCGVAGAVGAAAGMGCGVAAVDLGQVSVA